MIKMEFPQEADKALANIGRFFCAYSCLEAAIDNFLISAIRPQGLMYGHSLFNEVDMFRKIDLIKKLVSHQIRFYNGGCAGDDWKKEVISYANKAIQINDFRQKMAHSYIAPLENGDISIQDRKKILKKGQRGDVYGHDSIAKEVDSALEVAHLLTLKSNDLAIQIVDATLRPFFSAFAKPVPIPPPTRRSRKKGYEVKGGGGS